MMSAKAAICVLLWTYFYSGCYSASYTDSMDLVSDVLAKYDTRQRPVIDQSHGLVVSVGFFLFTIQDFNEVSGKFSVYGLMGLSWTDQVITWDPNDYGNVYSAVFRLSDIWYPKLVLTNPYSKLSDLGEDWMIVRIFNSGFTSFVPGAVFDTSCSVDVTYYPFDTQTCSLTFAVWGYVGLEVYLVPYMEKVDTTHFSENGQWSLESTNVSRIAGSISASDTVVFSFTMKRKSTFLVVNVILPIIFLAVMNMLVFLLPAESGERVGYSVTVLLALAVFMTLLGDNLPKTSEPMPILSYYLMILMISSTIIAFVTILNLKLYFKTGEVPACLKALYKLLICFPCRSRKKKMNGGRKVYPSEGEKPDIVGLESTEDEPEITWQKMSAAVDWIALTVFFLGTFIVNTHYLVVLVQNK